VALELLAEKHRSMIGDVVTMKIADFVTVAVTMADNGQPAATEKIVSTQRVLAGKITE
jgi:hypothetical protein